MRFRLPGAVSRAWSNTSRTPGDFDDRAASRAKAVARALLAFVIAPNLLFALIGAFLYTTRPAINLDYVLLGAAWLWLPLWARASTFAFALVLDAVGSTAPMYNINPLAGLVALTKAPLGLIITVVISFAVAVAVAVAIGIFAVRFLSDKRRRFLIFSAMIAVIVIAKLAHVSIASGAVQFAGEIRDRMRSASVKTYPLSGATERLRADVRKGQIGTSNVLLVVVESMGALTDSAGHHYVFEPITTDSVKAVYDVSTGTVPFRGGTTSGELRELCGIFADYITLRARVFPNCLPHMLRERNFETFAVHGYKPSYYNRERWYPKLFDHVYFEDDLDEAAGSRRCGTQFRGICDRDAIQTVMRLLKGGSQRMVYWMTLDAHTPVDMARGPEFRPPCDNPPEVCLQMAFWHDMFKRLAVLALDPALPPTRIVIVGDHAPAFVRRDRAAFFVPARVPYIELMPKRH
jgi:phosphoglycerol transferase MdoB-like AlkP superfamily enzyme